MTKAPTVVLLGGSGLGPWAWERVKPILNAGGLRALTPQLRATSGDVTPAAEVSLVEWIDDVSGFLAAHDHQDICLVAHSFAGYVAAGALAFEADRIRTVVFLDAVLPEPGRSWFDVMGPDVEQFMSGLAENDAIPFFTREQLDQLYPGHGISEADWKWMQPRLRAQPLATYAQPAISEPLNSEGATRLAYVQCRRTVPPAADISASSPGWTFRTLDTGHWPMVTNPEATAKVINELATP